MLQFETNNPGKRAQAGIEDLHRREWNLIILILKTLHISATTRTTLITVPQVATFAPQISATLSLREA